MLASSSPVRCRHHARPTLLVLLCAFSLLFLTCPSLLAQGLAPGQLVVSATNATIVPGQVLLTWQSTTGATSFLIERATASAGPYTAVATTTSITYTDSGLANGVYYYRLTSQASTTTPAVSVVTSVAVAPRTYDPQWATGFKATSGFQSAPNLCDGSIGDTSTYYQTGGLGPGGAQPPTNITAFYDLGATPAAVLTAKFTIEVLSPGSGVYAIDVSADGVSWVTETLGSTSSLTANTFAQQVFTAANPISPRYWRVSVSDSGSSGISDFRLFNSSGTAVASLPVITSPGDQTLTLGTSFSSSITAIGNPTSYGALNLPPGLSINSTTGAISGTPTREGTYSVILSAKNSIGTGGSTPTFTVTGPSPTITVNPSASPTPVTGTTTNLMASATDSTDPNLTYTWTCAPNASVSFSNNNGTTTGNNVTATFSQKGSYTLTVTVTNSSGGTASRSAFVTVAQTAASTALTPATVYLPVGATQQFRATQLDQFGFAMQPQPTFTWPAPVGVGSINGTGLYTAGASGNATIVAQSGGVTSNTAKIFVGYGPTADAPAPGWAEEIIPDSGDNGAGIGPAASMSMSIPSAVEENNPGADLWSYNPLGPTASFARSYRSALVSSTYANNYASPGLSPGWTHNYDVAMDAVSPGTWGNLTLRYSTGATETLTPSLSAGAPTGAFSHTAGVPYTVTGSSSSTAGQWNSITITYPDRSKIVFQTNASSSPATPNHYVLKQIVNIVGHKDTLSYDSANRLTGIVNDAAAPATLLTFAYDSNGYLHTITSYDGSGTAQRQVTYSRDTNGNLWTVSTISDLVNTPSTTITRWQYGYTTINGYYYLTQVQAPDAASPGSLTSATVQYDGSGHVQKHVDSNARETRLGYTATGQASLGYFPNSTATVPDLGWSQNYDSAAHTNVDTGFIDAASRSSSISYSGSPNVYLPTLVTNRNNEQEEVSYDNYGNITDSWNTSRKIRTHMTFTNPGDFAIGQLTGTQVFNDQYSDNLAQTTYGYFGTSDGVYNGLLKTETTPIPGTNSHTAIQTAFFSYTGTTTSSLGNLYQIIAPGPNSTPGATNTYTVTTYGYGNFTIGSISYSKSEAVDEPTSISVIGQNPAGSTSTTTTQTQYFEYDVRGHCTAEIDALGNKKEYEYNVADQVKRIWYPSDSNGSNRGAHTLYEYQYPGGPLTDVKLYAETDPGETGTPFREIDYSYGHEGELIEVTGDTNPMSYGYDSAYRMTSLTYYQAGGAGFTTHYDYDAIGNLIAIRYPNDFAGNRDRTEYGYDADQNLQARTDGRNVVTTYVRDTGIDSRLTGITYSDGTTPSVGYSYDHFDRTSTESNANESLAYTYDDLGDLLTQTTSFNGGPQNVLITYGYYPDGSRSQMIGPIVAFGLSTFTYQYDGVSRLTYAGYPWQNSGITTGYYANGWIQSVQGVSVNSQFTYTGRGLLAQNLNYWNLTPDVAAYWNRSTLGAKSFAGTVSGDYTTSITTTDILYDATGNRQQQATYLSAPSGTPGTPAYQTRIQTFAYDNLGHLTKDQSSTSNPYYNGGGENYTISYRYDSASNITDVTSPSGYESIINYNADNQFSTGESYTTYDRNGNWYFGTPTFDAENRLLQSGPPPGSSSTSPGTVSAYGPDGLRCYRSDPDTGNQYFIYNGETPIYALSSSGAIITTRGWSADGLRAMYDSNWGSYEFQYDPSGNLSSDGVVLANPTSPEFHFTSNISDYNAYGTSIYRASTEYYGHSPVDVGFSSQYGGVSDEYSRYVLMTHRFYLPGNYNFLTRDPIGYKGGINLYLYADGNPVNNVDPNGTQSLGNQDSDPWAYFNREFAGATPKDWLNWTLNNDTTRAVKSVINGALSFPIPENPIADAEVAEEGLALAGEDLYVGTYSRAKGALTRAGKTRDFVPHHVTQDAVSNTTHSRGITITIRRSIHNTLTTTGRPARILPTRRAHLSADIRELRNVLKENGYKRSLVNRQLKELIRQNKSLGGYEK